MQFQSGYVIFEKKKKKKSENACHKLCEVFDIQFTHICQYISCFTWWPAQLIIKIYAD